MPLYVRILQVTALPADAGETLDAHRRHVEELRAAGRIRAAGVFPGGEGCLEIFEARDRLEAEEIARASPLVTDGHAAWIVREWIEESNPKNG